MIDRLRALRLQQITAVIRRREDRYAFSGEHLNVPISCQETLSENNSRHLIHSEENIFV
jgi:hypothetical protein